MIQNIKNQTKIILDSIADGVFTVDSDWKITSFNRAAEKITGIKKEEAIGRYCWEVFKASICEKGCSLKRTVETGQSRLWARRHWVLVCVASLGWPVLTDWVSCRSGLHPVAGYSRTCHSSQAFRCT